MDFRKKKKNLVLCLTHSLLGISPNIAFSEASRVVFWPLYRYKELKFTTKPFIGHALSKWEILSSGMRRRQNFAFFPPFFFRFSPLVIFLFCWALIGFISVGKVFGKAFRILGLDERKGKWVVEQDFYGNFRVNVAWFLAFFSCLLDQLMLILVWFKRTSSPCTS